MDLCVLCLHRQLRVGDSTAQQRWTPALAHMLHFTVARNLVLGCGCLGQPWLHGKREQLSLKYWNPKLSTTTTTTTTTVEAFASSHLGIGSFRDCSAVGSVVTAGPPGLQPLPLLGPWSLTCDRNSERVRVWVTGLAIPKTHLVEGISRDNL